ncbi:MAG TPA: selenocysteine-specific translation elongation factor [Candidatus Eisenbacteria bacterium]
MTGRRFAVLGTAGHIDHGKTALVRLLTGIDTDRLKEEKERGISIDLGFAHLSLPDGTECGLVDVPGHERFVKNMLAGVGGIDAVLFVIAADEGVMPQTREHMDILRLLDVRRGVVALTKSDMVDADWLDFVTEEVRDWLAKGPLAGAPIVPVSSKTGAGREAVLEALVAALAELPERSQGRPARLPVDRVFSVEGFGTVVTGTLWQGTLRTGDRVTVEPGNLSARLRSVQVHGHDVDAAYAGQRTAVALHGIDKSQVERGHWVVAPDSVVASFMIDARLHVVPDAERPLANRQRIRFHLGASEILGRVVLLDKDELEPGASAMAQLRLEGPVAAERGDRFVLRSYSPQRAIGGGVVVLPNPEKHRRHDAGTVARLEVEEEGGPLERTAQALASCKGAIDVRSIAKAAALEADAAGDALDELVRDGRAHHLDDGRFLDAAAAGALESRLLEAARAWQGVSVYRWGMPRGDLKSQLPREVDPALFDHLVNRLAAAGRLFVRDDRFRADTPEPHLSERDAGRMALVRSRLGGGGFAPPTLKEMEADPALAPGLGEVLASLVAGGEVVKLAADFYYPRATLESMASGLKAFFSGRTDMRVADLKDLFGISRKHAVPVLEYFDRLGVTRRMGDVRVAGRLLAGDGGAA